MSLALLVALFGCGTATPEGHWAPSEWKAEQAPAAKTAEPPAPAKPSEPAPSPTPATALLPTAPRVVPETPPPVITPTPSPTAAVETPPPPAEKPVVDEAQLARDRAKAAIVLLDNSAGGVRAAVCSARSLLVQIPDSFRKEPLVVDAENRVKSKEPAALREEQAEFEENRMYLCRDGTPSPSCSCNGPKRGCCSHHGGVAGCEPLPTQFTCP